MRKGRVYIDTNVFVLALSDKKAKDVLITGLSGDAITSFLTWDEFVWVMRSVSGYELAKEKGRALLGLGVSFCDVTADVVSKAQDLIEKYNAKPRDALHAATAILQGAASIVSDDADFDKIAGLKRIAIKDY